MNNRRLLSSIGYLPPAKAEANHSATTGYTTKVCLKLGARLNSRVDSGGDQFDSDTKRKQVNLDKRG